MTQSRAEQDRLMEEQRLGRGDYEDTCLFVEALDYDDNYDDGDDEVYNCDELCACRHIREDHVEYVGECCNCDCQNFRPSTL
jgi:hypothetical protein